MYVLSTRLNIQFVWKLQTGKEIIVSTFALAHKNVKTGGQKDFYATNIFLMWKAIT